MKKGIVSAIACCVFMQVSLFAIPATEYRALAASAYNIVDATPYSKDVIKALADEVRSILYL